VSSKTPIPSRKPGRRPHPLKADALALAAETIESSGDPKYGLDEIAEMLELLPSTVRKWVSDARKEV